MLLENTSRVLKQRVAILLSDAIQSSDQRKYLLSLISSRITDCFFTLSVLLAFLHLCAKCQNKIENPPRVSVRGLWAIHGCREHISKGDKTTDQVRDFKDLSL